MKAGININSHPIFPPGRYAMGVLFRVAQRPFPAKNTSTAVLNKLLQFNYIRLEKRNKNDNSPSCAPVNYMVATKRGLIALDSFRKNRRASRLLRGGMI